MDTRDVPPVGKSSQTMETKRICILVVNDDIICNNIVADMLQNCNHQVLHIGGVLNVLNAIWEIRDKLDLVLTNVHKLEPNGTEIVEHIREKLNLPILFMSPEMKDKMKTVSKDQPFSFAAYILHGSSQNVVSLWKSASEKAKAKMVAVFQQEKVQTTSMSNIAFETKNASSSINEAARFDKKSTSKEPKRKNEWREGSRDDPSVAKKPRVVWTIEMHQKFIEAIELLGHERAIPKKIVEVMGIPGLTRENVASHLQKYRGSLKRTQQTPLSSLSDNTTLNGFKGLYNLPSPSTSRLNSLRRNTTHLSQNSYTSIHKESITTSNSQYLNTCNTSKRKTYTNYQKYVPNLPNVRIYGDQVRNMLLTTGKSCPSGDCNQSSGSKFVGFRLTTDGNSIEFGSLEASNKDNISRQTHVSTAGTTYGDQSTTYTQRNLVSGEEALTSTRNVAQQLHLLGRHSGASLESQSVSGAHQHENTNTTQCVSVSISDSSQEQLAFLSMHGPMTENLVRSRSILGNCISRQQITTQELGILEPVNTEVCNISLFDQDTALQSTKTLANPVQDLSQHDVSLQNPSMPLVVFPRDQDFPMPPLETSFGNDLLENPMQFLEGISQSEQPYSPSSSFPQMQFLEEIDDEGNGSTPFDDELFRHDD
ncbi:Two-component response regulator ORR22 [Sesamum alatum]|uniref:Two-component response regulator ORR22 n=1 Tax=Sesamum alatum TaxID=300844 RepID=A0AAE2CE12_9LAMI|nr:Two-component response regulator ORR22 [Sesamum alatum]